MQLEAYHQGLMYLASALKSSSATLALALHFTKSHPRTTKPCEKHRRFTNLQKELKRIHRIVLSTIGDLPNCKAEAKVHKSAS